MPYPKELLESDLEPTVDEYLMSAWQQLSPGHDKRAAGIKFPQGFWPDLARLAVKQALSPFGHSELAFAEQQALARYRSDPVFAALSDEELTSAQTRARTARKGKASKGQNTAALLGDIKDLF